MDYKLKFVTIKMEIYFAYIFFCRIDLHLYDDDDHLFQAFCFYLKNEERKINSFDKKFFNFKSKFVELNFQTQWISTNNQQKKKKRKNSRDRAIRLTAKQRHAQNEGPLLRQTMITTKTQYYRGKYEHNNNFSMFIPPVLFFHHFFLHFV